MAPSLCSPGPSGPSLIASRTVQAASSHGRATFCIGLEKPSLPPGGCTPNARSPASSKVTAVA